MALVALAPLAVARRARSTGFSGCRSFLWPDARQSDRPSVWIHAVSVGETSAARDLILAIAEEYGDTHDLLLTNVTRAGQEYARSQFGRSVSLKYYPYDTPWGVGRFIRETAPSVAILVESEIWPNMILSLGANGTPLLVINGRMSAESARRFARFGALFRPVFRALGRVGATSRANAARFRALGAARVSITGNLKFDREPDASQAALGSALRERLLGAHPARRRILLCASTRPGEEEALLEHLRAQRLGQAVLVIVPRHPERAKEVAALLRRRGFSVAMKSAWAGEGSPTALVGDTLGEMFLYCALADAAIVCGSFLPYGGQNPHEPMLLGKPVVVGPHCRNFSLFVSGAKRRDALRQAADARQAVDFALELLSDPAMSRRIGDAGRAYAQSLGGAKEKSLALVRELLPRTPSSKDGDARQ